MTRRLLVLLVTLLAPAALAQPCTTSWTDAAGGAWADGSKWDNGVPTATSVACITLDGTYTVTVGGITTDVLRLGAASGTQTLVAGGTLAFSTSAEISANGVFEWTSGYMTSGTMTNSGLIRLTSSTGSRGVNGTTLRNQGTVEHSGTGLFYIYLGGRVENTAEWTVTEAGDLVGSTGPGTFVNDVTGTLTKSGGGLSTVSGGGLTFDNAGVIDVQEGEFRFDRPSLHTDATLTTASEAVLRFNTGGATFVGTIAGEQAGTLLTNDNMVAGADAEWAFSGTGIEWTGNYLDAGTLLNSGLIRLTGTTGSRGVRNADVVLRNEGTVEHSSTGAFYIYLGGRVENTAEWTVTEAGDLVGSTGPGTFVNDVTGTLTKSGGGLSTVSGGGLTFDNAGVIDVQEGEFRFDRPSLHTDATLTTASEAVLRFNTGGATFVGTIAGEQAGTLLTNDNMVAGADAEWAFSGTGIEWTGNYLDAGTLLNSGLIRLTGTTGSRGVRNADVVLRNEGTVEHSSTGAFYIYLAAAVENAAVWTVTGAGDYLGSTGPGTFANAISGRLTKAGEGTLTQVTGGGLVFENAGRIIVESGELDINLPFTHASTGAISGNGTLDVLGAGALMLDGITKPGSSPGLLTWEGDWSPTAEATLGIEVTGATPGTEYSQLAVTGTATLGGLLRMAFLDGYTPEVGDTYTILTCVTACTGEFDELGLQPGIGATVTVEANEVVVTITEVGLTISRFQPAGQFIVAPEGGQFRIKTVTANPTSAAISTQTWTTLTQPDGSTIDLTGAQPLDLAPGETSRNATLIVLDGEADAGFYTYRRYAGTQGVDTLAVGIYEFEKATLAAREEVPETDFLAEPNETVVEITAGEVTVDGMPTDDEESPLAAGLPTETRLRAPYPNPAFGRATVAFDLAVASEVRVALYDMTGRMVAVVADGPVAAGRHAVPLDASRLSTGVYVVRLTAGALDATQRLTVVR